MKLLSLSWANYSILFFSRISLLVTGKKKQIEKTVFYFINVLYVHKGPVKPLQHTQLAAKMIA